MAQPDARGPVAKIDLAVKAPPNSRTFELLGFAPQRAVLAIGDAEGTGFTITL